MSNTVKSKKKVKERTGYNAMQKHLLELLSFPLSKNELTELRDLLVNFYNDKVTKEASEIWKEKKLSNRKLNEFLKAS